MFQSHTHTQSSLSFVVLPWFVLPPTGRREESSPLLLPLNLRQIMRDNATIELFLADTDLFNDIVLSHLLPCEWWTPLPHFFDTWLRNYIAGTLLYLISGFLWCFYIYYFKRNVYLPKGIHLIMHFTFHMIGGFILSLDFDFVYMEFG